MMARSVAHPARSTVRDAFNGQRQNAHMLWLPVRAWTGASGLSSAVLLQVNESGVGQPLEPAVARQASVVQGPSGEAVPAL